MSNLAINFFKETITEKSKNEFLTAVSYENADMTIQLKNDEIAKITKKLNGDYTNEEKEGFKAQLKNLNIELDELKEKLSDMEETYKKVVNAMSTKNENGFGNAKDVVRTVLRVLASWDNSKLIKYAIIPAFESPELYEALEAIHIQSKAGENGNIIMSKEVKEAYKKASDELDKIIKVTFSLPFETEYTSKTRVKMTADDRKLLNDCYIKGFKNKFSTDDNGVVKFSKRTITTLVRTKKDKDGKVKYDYSGLATTIASIVIKHYFA